VGAVDNSWTESMSSCRSRGNFEGKAQERRSYCSCLRTHYGRHWKPFSRQNEQDCRILHLSVQSQNSSGDEAPGSTQRNEATLSYLFPAVLVPRQQFPLGWSAFLLSLFYETTTLSLKYKLRKSVVYKSVQMSVRYYKKTVLNDTVKALCDNAKYKLTLTLKLATPSSTEYPRWLTITESGDNLNVGVCFSNMVVVPNTKKGYTPSYTHAAYVDNWRQQLLP